MGVGGGGNSTIKTTYQLFKAIKRDTIYAGVLYLTEERIDNRISGYVYTFRKHFFTTDISGF